MTDPACYRSDCTERNHCDRHEHAVHHAVDSMAEWCKLTPEQRAARAARHAEAHDD